MGHKMTNESLECSADGKHIKYQTQKVRRDFLLSNRKEKKIEEQNKSSGVHDTELIRRYQKSWVNGHLDKPTGSKETWQYQES